MIYIHLFIISDQFSCVDDRKKQNPINQQSKVFLDQLNVDENINCRILNNVFHLEEINDFKTALIGLNLADHLPQSDGWFVGLKLIEMKMISPIIKIFAILLLENTKPPFTVTSILEFYVF